MTKSIYLDKNSPEIEYLCQKDKHLAKVIEMVGPLKYQTVQNNYSFLVREIIGQMLSNKVDHVLTQRLVNKCNGKITLNSIDKLTNSEIQSIGISNSKVNYIRSLSQAIASKTIDFSSYSQMPDCDIINSLTQIKGIGPWSAKMFLIFSLNRPDVLPYEDMAFLQGYSWIYKTDNYEVKKVTKKCKKWHPYASIAARYLYKALDMGLTKKAFHLYK